jgi:hypothetical protein
MRGLHYLIELVRLGNERITLSYRISTRLRMWRLVTPSNFLSWAVMDRYTFSAMTTGGGRGRLSSSAGGGRGRLSYSTGGERGRSGGILRGRGRGPASCSMRSFLRAKRESATLRTSSSKRLRRRAASSSSFSLAYLRLRSISEANRGGRASICPLR